MFTVRVFQCSVPQREKKETIIGSLRCRPSICLSVKTRPLFSEIKEKNHLFVRTSPKKLVFLSVDRDVYRSRKASSKTSFGIYLIFPSKDLLETLLKHLIPKIASNEPTHYNYVKKYILSTCHPFISHNKPLKEVSFNQRRHSGSATWLNGPRRAPFCIIGRGQNEIYTVLPIYLLMTRLAGVAGFLCFCSAEQALAL